MRKLLWLLLPIPLLLVIVYTALPYVARTLIEQWLSEQGFEAPHIQLSHPGWERLKVDSLTLTQRGPERRITLHTQDVSIYFDPLALLLEQRLREIRIPQLQLEILAEQSLEQRLDAVPSNSLDLNPLPPTLLFHYAPSERLVIGELDIEYRAPQQPRLRATGNLDLTAQRLLSRMRLSLQDPADSDRPLPSPAYLDLDFSAEQQLRLALVQANRPLLSAAGRLSSGPQIWGLDLDGTLQGDDLYRWLAPLLPAQPFSDLSGELSFTLSSQWPTQLPLLPEQLLTALKTRLAISGSARLSALELPQQGRVEQLAASLSGELRLAQGRLELTLTPQNQLTARGLTLPPLTANTLSATLQQPLSASLGIVGDAAESLRVTPLKLQLKPAGLVLEPLRSLTLSPLLLEIEPAPGLDSARFRLTTERIQAALESQSLPPTALTLEGRWQPDDLTGKLALESTAPALQFDADWRYLDRFYARWQLAPLALASSQTHLSRLIPQWPGDLTFAQGTLALQGTLAAASGSQWELAADASLKDTALAWGDLVAVEQLNAELSLNRAVNGTLGSSGQLSSARINTGLSLTDTRIHYHLSWPARGHPTLQLEPLRLNLLGGQLLLPALKFNPLAPDFATSVRLESLQLSDILQLYNQPGLAGSIPLSGTLPLQVKGLELQVSDGQLSNTAPGWIRYEPGAELSATASGNPALELALSALSNLQVAELALQVDYAPDGALALRTRLQGHNPGWQQGRPIDLSLNIEENLLQLLRSLQLSEQIGADLRQRLTQ